MDKITKVQELMYELKVRDVMKRDVIVVNADMLMSKLREIFRSHRISGTPVMSGDKLIGIISIEDFIKWLADGGGDCSISEKMTKKVVAFYEDEPLVQAINKMQRLNFGRFPILCRETNQLRGILTKGNIIEGILKKMEVDYHESEIQKYRASHIFEDIKADKITLTFQYFITGKDLSHAGESTGSLRTTLTRLGFPPGIIRRLAIAAYEAEANVIIYTDGGTMYAEVEPKQIYIKVEDSGPGIPDIEKAMEAGYSTAPDWIREMGFGAGMGLYNIKQCSDKMILTSTLGKGTCLEAFINIPEK